MTVLFGRFVVTTKQITMSKITEIWLPIVGYEFEYEVSNTGRVRSLTRTHVQKNGRRRTIKGVEKVLQVNIDGYHVVTLYHESRFKVKRVPVLVLEAFVGPRPSHKHVAMHLDNNKLNNNLSNLKWGTDSENVRHSVLSKTHYTPNYFSKMLGKLHHKSKVIIQRDPSGNIINRFYGAGEASRITGLSKFAISQNAAGKSARTRSGFSFEYESSNGC